MEQIEALALALKQGEWDADSEATFKSLVARQTDARRLKQVADEYTPYTRVSVPLYERVLELNPRDLNTVVMLGWVFWLDGEDERSREQLKRAKEIDPEDVQVLTLEANLTVAIEGKIKLYQKVLEADPDNDIARQNLSQLGGS